MNPYRLAWPIVRCLPPEFAHSLGLAALRIPIRWGGSVVADPFTWRGITFRNRVGIAAGFDKNATGLAGIGRIGAGFVEVGTILTEPWAGNQVSPRMARLIPLRGVWNRLGFTSRGLADILPRLQRFSRGDIRLALNIGPHPGKLKSAASPDAAVDLVASELKTLIQALHRHADLMVINLSSPNTPGLRSFLQSPMLTERIVAPVRRLLRDLDAAVPLLVKLPPEDQDREPWNEATLKAVTDPLIQTEACDGFVAVNTSTRLAKQLMPHVPTPELPGGISGDPLRPEALRVTALLRSLIGPDRLVVGCGGIVDGRHAAEFVAAGADLVEVYSGLIFSGPRLIADAARAIANPRQASESGA